MWQNPISESGQLQIFFFFSSEDKERIEKVVNHQCHELNPTLIVKKHVTQ